MVLPDKTILKFPGLFSQGPVPVFPSSLGSFKFTYSIPNPNTPSFSCVSWSFLKSMLPVLLFIYYSLRTSMISTFSHSPPPPYAGGVYLIILIYSIQVKFYNLFWAPCTLMDTSLLFTLGSLFLPVGSYRDSRYQYYILWTVITQGQLSTHW